MPSEKYFSNGVPSEKYTQKYNDRKINFFYVFAVTNSFFYVFAVTNSFSVGTCI